MLKYSKWKSLEDRNKIMFLPLMKNKIAMCWLIHLLIILILKQRWTQIIWQVKICFIIQRKWISIMQFIMNNGKLKKRTFIF